MALLQGGQGVGHVQLGIASRPCQPDWLDHDYGLDPDPVLWSEGGNKIPSMDPRGYLDKDFTCGTFALDGLFSVERDYLL